MTHKLLVQSQRFDSCEFTQNKIGYIEQVWVKERSKDELYIIASDIGDLGEYQSMQEATMVIDAIKEAMMVNAKGIVRDLKGSFIPLFEMPPYGFSNNKEI